MASRHEEKFLIDFRQYVTLRKRAEAAMAPDPHSPDGSYLINSVYFDDLRDSAYYEKTDGLKLHTKFRVRTYNCDSRQVNLEKKVKRGIMTEKYAARMDESRLWMLSDPDADLSLLTGRSRIMATEMRAGGLFPAVVVRYRRDAFVYPEADTRLTFDTEVEALPPDLCWLFDDSACGIPAIPRSAVILEVKYGEYLPAFVRKLCAGSGKQLSVSKYALCRDAYH